MIDEEECEVCIPFDQEWIFTYGDLVTLLFCFFVLLFSMCVYETEKFKSVADSFKPLPAGTPFISEGRDSVVEDISKKVEESELGDDADVNVEDKGKWSYPSGQAPSLRQIQLI
ncbi:MAG: flagellar motor protein MotB [bacterium]